MVVHFVSLLDFRHGRFVTHASDAAIEEHVHQGRFADVRDSHNQHAQRFRAAVAMRSERLTEPGYLGGIAGMTTGQGHGADALSLVEQIEPSPSDGGIGEIGLVEDFQARTLAGQAQFFDQRIGAGVRMRASNTSTMTSITSIVLAASLRAVFM